MKKFHTKTTFSLAAAIYCTSLAGPAMAATTLTDDFNTAHNYGSGVSGTIWSGIVNSGNFTALNSNTTTAGQLRMQAATNTGWEAPADNDAPLLYLNVTGDFDARVQVTAQTVGNYNTAYLMARLADPTANGGAGEDWISLMTDARSASTGIATRIATNGTGATGTKPTIALPEYLRLTRTGDTFNAFYSDNGTSWTALAWAGGSNDLVRTDLNGLSMQVGLAQGTFSTSGGSADFENFSIDIIPEPSAALLGSLGMLCLLRRRRTAM